MTFAFVPSITSVYLVSGFLRTHLSPSSIRRLVDEAAMFTTISAVFSAWYTQLPAEMQHGRSTSSPLVLTLNMTY